MDILLSLFSLTTLSSVLAASSPIVFAGLGETLSERAGVINLSVEGTMMLGAMTGFAVAKTTGSLVWGFLAAMLVGMLMALIVAIGSITLKRDQVAIGFVLALMGIELSSFLGTPFVRQQTGNGGTAPNKVEEWKERQRKAQDGQKNPLMS